MPTRGGGGGGGGGKKVDVSFVQQEVPAFLQRAQERLGVGQAADAARERARLGRIAAAGESLHADEAPTVVDSLEAHKDAGALARAAALATAAQAFGAAAGPAGERKDARDMALLEQQDGSRKAAMDAKAEGNAAFAAGDYEAAERAFSRGLRAAPLPGLASALHSNRSAARLALGDGEGALKDGEAAAGARPGWAKAHARRGAALLALGALGRAADAYGEAARLCRAATEGGGDEEAAKGYEADAAAARTKAERAVADGRIVFRKGGGEKRAAPANQAAQAAAKRRRKAQAAGGGAAGGASKPGLLSFGDDDDESGSDS